MKTLERVLEDWEAVIGLEIHTELTTLRTKMFCSCPIEYGDAPNTHTCPVCLGMPGALPVPNKAAIESIVLAGLATNCEIERRSMFYRKNYFYPDMAKNFQTTQGPEIAFCMRGHLELEVDGLGAQERYGLEDLAVGQRQGNIVKTDYGYVAQVGITRIHMEEDAGKMVHVGGVDGRIAGATHSLIDYNRAGTPLIELVTEPDLRTPNEARLFMQELRSVFLALGISDCSMEEGSMRCDGNVSLRPRGSSELGVKTELKNMNSFKNLHDGLAYEICRQAEVLESGGAIAQETRHWEPANKRTITMRVKETADDYRLFPEPDLAPYDLSDEFVESVRAKLPELPGQKKARFEECYGLGRAESALIAGDAAMAAFFDEAMAIAGASSVQTGGHAQQADMQVAKQADMQADKQLAKQIAKQIANVLVNDVAAYLNANGIALSDAKIEPAGIVELVGLIAEGTISSKQGKEVFQEMAATGASPAKIVEDKGLRQVSDEGLIREIVGEIIAAEPDKVAAYRGGKTGLSGFFIGQVMKKTKGQANPKLVSQIVTEMLEG